MIINLNDEWRIRSEPLNWIVERMPSPKEGVKRKKDVWRPVSYHGTLDSAVVSCARKRIAILDGEYGAEALTPLGAALDALVGEGKKALAA